VFFIFPGVYFLSRLYFLILIAFFFRVPPCFQKLRGFISRRGFDFKFN